MGIIVNFDEMDQAKTKIDSIIDDISDMTGTELDNEVGYDVLSGAIASFDSTVTEAVTKLETSISKLSSDIDTCVKSFHAEDVHAGEATLAINSLLSHVDIERLG